MYETCDIHNYYLLYIAKKRHGLDCHSLATMMVLELPPRLSLSSQVSTESRYGMNTCFRCLPFSDTSAKGERKMKTL